MHLAPHGRAVAVAGWVALIAWLTLRWNAMPALELGTVQQALTYFYVDASFPLLALAIALFARSALRARDGWVGAALIAAVSCGVYYVRASTRYYFGASLAFDLANYAQPMWRAAHGLSMISATYDSRPIWADHGSLAMFLFAPFTRLSDNLAGGLFIAQSVVTACGILTAYGCGLALGLPPYAALATGAVLASSRALASATSFDFHAECALGPLLLGVAAARAHHRLWLAAALTLAAASLRDMAALTTGMAWAYWAVRDRGRERLAAVALAAICVAVAVVDIVALPRWTGWPSYAAMNASAPIDLGLAMQTTFLRALSTFGLGWLHPIAWASGAPWIAAAAASPKLLVKGLHFQYGYLFVPVATLGAIYALAWIAARAPRRLAIITCAWAALAVAVNAPVRVSTSKLVAARAAFDAVRAKLEPLVSPSAAVAADACAAPYVMQREQLTLLCRLDVEHLQQTGDERWEHPVDAALEATRIVVTPGCQANGPCVDAQIARAEERGFKVIARPNPYIVFARQSDH